MLSWNDPADQKWQRSWYRVSAALLVLLILAYLADLVTPPVALLLGLSIIFAWAY
jgi:hypothetical protein